MKKIIAIVTIILAALSLASCNMDFYSSDSMTSAQLAENPSSAVYTTDGIYTLFKDRIAYTRIPPTRTSTTPGGSATRSSTRRTPTSTPSFRAHRP